jgi:hypothetical protein
MQEEWKDIIGYEGYYQISNLGKVKSLERVVMVERSYGKVKLTWKEKILKGAILKGGYYTIHFCVYNKKKRMLFHRLIAIHFIDNPSNLTQVNHIDGNKLNNAIENLEWVSNRENSCHAKKNVKSSSQYTGVCWHKRDNKWASHIYHKGKLLHLGVFNTEEEAYNARIKFEQENNIENKYI